MNYKEMTVEQMAKVIKMYENDAYKRFKLYEKVCRGDDEVITGKARSSWAALYNLCKELEINNV